MTTPDDNDDDDEQQQQPCTPSTSLTQADGPTKSKGRNTGTSVTGLASATPSEHILSHRVCRYAGAMVIRFVHSEGGALFSEYPVVV